MGTCMLQMAIEKWMDEHFVQLLLILEFSIDNASKFISLRTKSIRWAWTSQHICFWHYLYLRYLIVILSNLRAQVAKKKKKIPIVRSSVCYVNVISKIHNYGIHSISQIQFPGSPTTLTTKIKKNMQFYFVVNKSSQFVRKYGITNNTTNNNKIKPFPSTAWVCQKT